METRNADFMHGMDWLNELCPDFNLSGTFADLRAAEVAGVDSAAATFWNDDDEIVRIQSESSVWDLATWLSCHQDEDGFFYSLCESDSRRYMCLRCSLVWCYDSRIDDQALQLVAHFIPA